MNETNRLRRNAKIAAAVVVALMIVCVGFAVSEAHGDDRRKPVDPPMTCVHVDQAQCRALLTNSWDGRQVVHQLDPVPVCTSRGGQVLQDRLERKNRTLAQLRDKVARLRARAAR